MQQWTVRVIDKLAERNNASFFEIANNMWVPATSKQEARKFIYNQLTEKGLIYGRDFVLGSVGHYTGTGVSVGFVGDVFKTCVPHHTFIAYKQVQIEGGKKDDIKYEKYTHTFCMKKCPDSLDQPTYICSNGQFIVYETSEKIAEQRQNDIAMKKNRKRRDD